MFDHSELLYLFNGHRYEFRLCFVYLGPNLPKATKVPKYHTEPVDYHLHDTL